MRDDNRFETPIHIGTEASIHGKYVAAQSPIAIEPIGGEVTRVTMTILTNQFEVDWSALNDNVEIIAPEDIWGDRASAVGNERKYIRADRLRCLLDEMEEASEAMGANLDGHIMIEEIRSEFALSPEYEDEGK